MSRRSRRKTKNRHRQLPLAWIAIAGITLIGVALLFAVGRHFSFHHQEQASQVSKIAFFALLPLIIIGRLTAAPDTEPSTEPPQSLLFAGINWIILTALIAGAVVVGAHGYIALFNAVFGETLAVNAKVCCGRESDPWEDTRCEYFVSIIYDQRKTVLCLDDFQDPVTDIEDGNVTLTIRRSAIGYTIDELAFPPRLQK